MWVNDESFNETILRIFSHVSQLTFGDHSDVKISVSLGFLLYFGTIANKGPRMNKGDSRD